MGTDEWAEQATWDLVLGKGHGMTRDDVAALIPAMDAHEGMRWSRCSVPVARRLAPLTAHQALHAGAHASLGAAAAAATASGRPRIPMTRRTK